MKKNIDLGMLISRIAIGFPMSVYGINKLIHGVGFIENMMTMHGLPSFFAYGVFAGEIIAPVMLIIGFRTRFAGLIFAANCFTATILAQTGNLFKLNDFGGWALELLVIYMLISLSFFFTGAGKYAVSTNNKWD
ncbi:DoxX family protein [Chryseobacterium indologenes]|uniref:DoxX family protein n=1 Tax=Chryseobacterium indologenes TaxID=253 RepID=A0A5R9PQ79_CHRID|nr:MULTISPECIES: DoxX family protein [Chryseobacterium]ASE60828.1 DoxX family protein [Chryseobacterium indologenes]ATN04938.1 DoxX family protein [Chryseobacterium indologenes]AYY86310.1 DoxX family protein [Chryseobacterium indologenes]AYZ36085.1 DoxX family protein [Chryseobacterium indologenes]AZB16521.1 DoxX family protein [Chryseobacterium indologenes]